MPTRTESQVRSDIEREREHLADAVEHLRGELGAATDIGGKLKSKLPIVAGAAASAGFVLAGGIGATMRYFARRSREH
jgi:shikimate kinase